MANWLKRKNRYAQLVGRGVDSVPDNRPDCVDFINALTRVKTAGEMQQYALENRHWLTKEFIASCVQAIHWERENPHTIAALVSLTATLAGFIAKQAGHSEAAGLFGLAAHLAQALANKATRRDLLVEQGRALEQPGRHDEAIHCWREAIELCQRLEDGDKQAEVNSLLGIAHRLNWQADLSIECLEAALRYYEQRLSTATNSEQAFHLTKQAGFCHSLLGMSHSQTGEAKPAIRHFEEALRIARQQGSKESERDRMGNRARVYAVSGEREKAIQEYLAARAITVDDERKDARATMLIDMNLGNLYRELNQLRNATAYYKRALKSSRKSGDQTSENRLLTSLGIINKARGELEATAEHYQSALQLAEKIGDKIGEAEAAGHMGNYFYQTGRPQEALTHYDRALLIAEKLNDWVYVSRWMGNKANALLALNRPEEAKELYERALAIAKQYGDYDHQYLWRYNLGKLHAEWHQEFETAYDYFKEAISSLDELRRSVKHDDHSRTYGENRVFVYQDMVAACYRLPERKDEIISIIEKAKGYTLTRIMAEANLRPRDSTPPNLSDQWQRLRIRRREIEGQFIVNLPVEERAVRASAKEKAKLIGELIRIRGEQAENYRAIAEYDPLFNEIFNPTAVTLKEVQEHLRGYEKKTVLVEFFVARTQTFVFIAGSEAYESDVIPIPDFTERILVELCENNWLEPYADSWKNRDKCRSWLEAINAIGQVLYDRLWRQIGPFVDRLAPERLILTPHLGLHLLPLHLIKIPADSSKATRISGSHYLCDQYEIVYAPSFRMLTYCRSAENRKHRPLDFFGISNPDHSLDFADVEALAIRNLFESSRVLHHESATREAILKEAEAYSVLHLASHGRGATLPKDGLESGITTGDWTTKNKYRAYGRLTAKQIFLQMNLPDSFVVVLSACETGMVKLDRSDEYIGLPAAFLKAGAPAVISSLWSVENISTTLLMYRWYRYICQCNMPRAGALSAAQKWLRRLTRAKIIKTLHVLANEIEKSKISGSSLDESTFRQNLLAEIGAEIKIQSLENPYTHPYEHPYYWAGFILSGDPE